MKASDVVKELEKYASEERRKVSERFFKTGEGEYGHGDIFRGVSIPDSRRVAKQFYDLSLSEVKKLFSSKIHEERMVAHHILTDQFPKADEEKQQQIYNFYLKHTKHINNWDLVDTSAHKIVAAYLLTQPQSARKVLYALAKSKNMWERRIAIVSTWWFIRNGQLEDTFRLAKGLLTDKEDLMHKAVGWMLREAGKKDEEKLRVFLKKHGKHMPRTMLRYAIEKFPEKERKAFLESTRV